MHLNFTEILINIQRNGPTRVVINGDGEATTPSHARLDRGITPDVVFIRNDGWSLGAPAHYEDVARGMWEGDWVAVTRKPFETYQLM